MADLQDLIRQLEQTFDWDKQLNETEMFNVWKDHVLKINQAVQAQPQLQQLWDNYRKPKSLEMKDRGNQELQNGNNDKAALWFSLAILLDPFNAVFFSNRSAAYINLGKYREALTDAEEAIKINPNWSRGYSRKAMAANCLKLYDEAVSAYKAALALEPNNESLKVGLEQAQQKVKAMDANALGEEMAAKNRLPQAIDLFNQAINLDPNEPIFYTNRCDAFLKSGRYTEALHDADTAIALRPDWLKGFQRRAEALLKLNRYEEAAGVYSYAAQMDPTNTYWQRESLNAIQEGTRYRARQEMEAKQKESKEQKEKDTDKESQ